MLLRKNTTCISLYIYIYIYISKAPLSHLLMPIRYQTPRWLYHFLRYFSSPLSSSILNLYLAKSTTFSTPTENIMYLKSDLPKNPSCPVGMKMFFLMFIIYFKSDPPWLFVSEKKSLQPEHAVRSMWVNNN